MITLQRQIKEFCKFFKFISIRGTRVLVKSLLIVSCSKGFGTSSQYKICQKGSNFKNNFGFVVEVTFYMMRLQIFFIASSVLFYLFNITTQQNYYRRSSKYPLWISTEDPSELLIRYADLPNDPIEPYFDRIVVILADRPETPYLDPEEVINIRYNGFQKHYFKFGIGILLEGNKVLTTYQPFRRIMKSRKFKKNILVAGLENRFFEKFRIVEYKFGLCPIKCAQQVLQLIDSEITDDQWFGTQKQHSPVHDLMILALREHLPVMHPKTVTDYSKMYHNHTKPVKSTPYNSAGPLLSTIAKNGDHLGKEIMIASVACVNDVHIWQDYLLVVKRFNEDEDVLEDCEQWLPREWGYFICVRNVMRYEGLGSGSLLVYNETVYGFGCFLLDKGNASILVFTDVRRYEHIINDRKWSCPYKKKSTPL